MNSYQGTFQRYEIKYLLDELKYSQLILKLENHFKIDQFGKVTICNIYFDTPDYYLIRSSLDKPVYKEKLRLRSYGTPFEGDTVFVELKKKYKGVVYKRRESLELFEAESYLYDKEPIEKVTQITKEIDWFMKSHPNLIPAMYISYDRIAMYGLEDRDLRVTFDHNILWREDNLWLGNGNWGKSLLEQGQILMEIKLPGAMPIWLSHILDELEIYPTSYSKYGKGYLQLMEQQRNKRNQGDKKYA